MKIEKEGLLKGTGGTDSRIHGIFGQYANSREYNQTLMQNDFDIEWLEGNLEREDYRKLEDSILNYCSRNEELVFQLGFQYAWSLFQECLGQE